jgi:hypothetical protein
MGYRPAGVALRRTDPEPVKQSGQCCCCWLPGRVGCGISGTGHHGSRRTGFDARSPGDRGQCNFDFARRTASEGHFRSDNDGCALVARFRDDGDLRYHDHPLADIDRHFDNNYLGNACAIYDDHECFEYHHHHNDKLFVDYNDSSVITYDNHETHDYDYETPDNHDYETPDNHDYETPDNHDDKAANHDDDKAAAHDNDDVLHPHHLLVTLMLAAKPTAEQRTTN